MFDGTIKGKSTRVLRSIRHAPQDLVLRGSITPQKVKPSDIDDLCDLFVKKVKVSPKKKKPSGSTPDENSANVIVSKTDATALSSIKRGKEEAKAEALAKAKAWNDARASRKTANSMPESYFTNEAIFNIKRGKEEAKADALAKAKAWNDARATRKAARAQSFATNEADCARENFSNALKAMSVEAKEAAAISKEAAAIFPRRSSRGNQ